MALSTGTSLVAPSHVGSFGIYYGRGHTGFLVVLAQWSVLKGLRMDGGRRSGGKGGGGEGERRTWLSSLDVISIWACRVCNGLSEVWVSAKVDVWSAGGLPHVRAVLCIC